MCVDDNEENVFKNLSNRYRESALEFSNLESTNNLPSLKIQMQKNNNSSAQNFTGNRVTICK
jgi:hypothetical protein